MLSGLLKSSPTSVLASSSRSVLGPLVTSQVSGRVYWSPSKNRARPKVEKSSVAEGKEEKRPNKENIDDNSQSLSCLSALWSQSELASKPNNQRNTLQSKRVITDKSDSGQHKKSRVIEAIFASDDPRAASDFFRRQQAKGLFKDQTFSNQASSSSVSSSEVPSESEETFEELPQEPIFPFSFLPISSSLPERSSAPTPNVSELKDYMVRMDKLDGQNR